MKVADMTIESLHTAMSTLCRSTYIEVRDLDGKEVLYLGYLDECPFDIYENARVYSFNPESKPMRFYVAYEEKEN